MLRMRGSLSKYNFREHFVRVLYEVFGVARRILFRVLAEFPAAE